MKKIQMKIKVLIVGLSALNFVSAQDIHFSQMGYSPLTLNPALAGANYDLQVNANYRSQWNSVAEPFQTVAVSADTRLNFSKNRRRKKDEKYARTSRKRYSSFSRGARASR